MKKAFALLWESLVRTYTPLIVGVVMGLFAGAQIVVDPQFEGALTTLLSAAFSAVYYLGARLLEHYVSPKFGWLLGLNRSPDTYSKGNASNGTSAAEGSYPGMDGDTYRK